MRIRWLRKLDGTMELQHDRPPLPHEREAWEPVEIVTEESEAQAAIYEQLAAKAGVTPSQVRRIEELLKKPATDGLVIKPKP